jgi:hypothetical protein
MHDVIERHANVTDDCKTHADSRLLHFGFYGSARSFPANPALEVNANGKFDRKALQMILEKEQLGSNSEGTLGRRTNRSRSTGLN